MIDTQPNSTPDLAAYVGRWIAVVRGRVVGVGQTADEARQLALHNRPKEAPEVFFVSAERQIAQATAKIPLIVQIFDLAKAQRIEIYLVGGSVRDLLLGRPTHDLDFVVDGDGLAVARRIADALHAAYVPIDHERKTGRVIFRDGSLYVDIAALRGPDLLADLRDRDFTLNAIAVTQTSNGGWRLIDPLGGRGDLEQGVLRAASPTSFEHDPLRTMRAVRMCAQFDCTLHPDTERALRAAASGLSQVSAERIRDEWFKILALPGAAQAIHRLDELGLLGAIIPHFAAGGPARAAFDHAAATVEALERLLTLLTQSGEPSDPLASLRTFATHLAQRYETTLCDERSHLTLLKCAALLHQIDPGADRAAEIAAGLARRWRCSNHEIDLLRTAVAAHAELPGLAAQSRLSRRDVYLFYRKSGSYGTDAGCVDAALIALACQQTQHQTQPRNARARDALTSRQAQHRTRSRDAHWRRWAATAAKLVEAYFLRYHDVIDPPLLLTGSDLIALGIEPGPHMGELLSGLREEQAAGKICTREQALAYIQTRHQTQKGEQ